MAESSIYRLFDGYGIELEYMIVDNASLKAKPISDQILREMAGEDAMSVTLGNIAWSNELAMHVIELKANGPKKDLCQLHRDMREALVAMNERLAVHGARLLPTGMHPFFDPATELQLWDSEDSEIYASYDRIFGCQGHGWANLQSIHINLPFCGDEEFAPLHTAIRLLLPLMPAVAASSPFVEGKKGPWLDNRVRFYLQNQRRIASIIGQGIPEAVRSKADYEKVVLEPMYKDIAPFDPDGLLQYEWLNSRAAIARFERNAIEIRILDIQECLRADFTIISAFVGLIQDFVAQVKVDFDQQFSLSVPALRGILDGVLEEGLSYVVQDRAYLSLFQQKQPCRAADLLSHAVADLQGDVKENFRQYESDFQFLLQSGSLSQRVLRVTGSEPSAAAIEEVYKELAICLRDDRFFTP